VRDDQGFHDDLHLANGVVCRDSGQDAGESGHQESPYLREASNGTDSIEVKQFGTSFLYLKGAASTNAPISIPTDMLIHDELDFSDSHRDHAVPVAPDALAVQVQGEVEHADDSRKGYRPGVSCVRAGTYQFVKCNHCGHQFIPDFFAHVRIPDYSGELLDITRANLHCVDYKEAFVECPNCGRQT
jgi:hypothetical protein